MRTLRLMAAAAGTFVVLGASAQAQDAAPTAAGHPWAAFFGCWMPIDGTPSMSVTCILPGESSPFEAEQLSLVGQAVVRRIALRADGARQEVNDQGCTGFEVAAFSDDAARVYTRGSATCGASPEQLTTGVFSITPDGHLLQVVGVRVGEQRTVTTQRFGRLRYEDLPASMRDRVSPLDRAASGARTLAAQPVKMPIINEMLEATDASVVEAWMAETGTGFEPLRLTRRDLQQMSDANVPTRVIDLAVVLANPSHFQPSVERVASSGGGGGGKLRSINDPYFSGACSQFQVGAGGVWGGSFPFWAPILYPGMGLSFYSWLPGCLSRAGFFGARFNNGFGWQNGWFGPWGGQGAVPVVVTTNPVTPGGSGTVTRGGGYSRGTGSGASGGTATPRGGHGTGTVTAAPATGSGGGSSAGVRSAGSGGTGRTAKPRNPDPQN